MKITIPAILLFLIIVCIPISTYASDITDADYHGNIIITNNGTAASVVATNMSLNSAQIIASSYVDSAFDGAAIITNSGTDAPFMPGYNTNPWCIYVPSMSASSSINYSLYTSPTDDFGTTKYYFPGTTGLGVANAVEMELNNAAFNWEIEAYFDTSAASINSDIIHATTNSYVRCYVQAASTIRASITVTGPTTYYCDATMATGYHKLTWTRPTAGSGNMTLYIDDIYGGSVALGAAGVVDDNSPWTFAESPAVVYMNYFSENVTGANVAFYEWEYGATFSDQSGEGNTATPTFRTNTSDADILAFLETFEPLNPARAPAYTVEDAPDFITGNITATGNFTTSSLPDASFPGADVIEDVSSESETPEIWMWGILAMMGIGISGIGISYARKKFGIGGGYVLGVTVIALLVFGILVTFGKFNWWMIWFYIIIAGGIAVASRHIDWGGATSQHGLIGFLAMSWVGMTLINRILEGSLITSSETAFLNTVSFTRAFDVLGMFTLPILNFSFFTQGIPSLMRWDYSYFGGQAQIIQYMLYSITAVVSFIIFGLVLGLVYNYFSRLR